jgi:hypothetical protein
VVPCVRFNYFVRLPASSIAATLGMGGWLALRAHKRITPRTGQAGRGAERG